MIGFNVHFEVWYCFQNGTPHFCYHSNNRDAAEQVCRNYRPFFPCGKVYVRRVLNPVKAMPE